MNNEMLNAQPKAFCATWTAFALQRARRCPLLLFYIVLASVFLLVVLGFEGTAYFEIFTWMGDGIQEIEQVLGPRMLTVMGLIALLAFHVIDLREGDSGALKLVKRLVAVFVASFMIGGGVLFASLMYYGGMDVIFAPDSGGGMDWNEAVTRIDNPLVKDFVEWLLANAGIFFVVGCCGFTLFCAITANWLAGRVHANVEECAELRFNARAAKEAMREIDAVEEENARDNAEIKRLEGELARLKDRIVNTVSAAVESQLHEKRRLLEEIDALPQAKGAFDDYFQTDRQAHIRTFNKIELQLAIAGFERIGNPDVVRAAIGG